YLPFDRQITSECESILTSTIIPFPSRIGDEKTRSMVLAPTVIIHGATFATVEGVGPSFPALQETTIFLLTACKDPIAIGSSV
ncbi:hypothetical protein H5410_007484, partial [Solanum commersonii]